jgi:hypothetical protein
MASIHVTIESLRNVLSHAGLSPMLVAADQFENSLGMGTRGLIAQQNPGQTVTQNPGENPLLA